VIWSALYPKTANGSTPNSLTLSPDGKVLLVANADNNNVAMFDVSTPKGASSLGFIPVGWYPTSDRFTADSKQFWSATARVDVQEQRFWLTCKTSRPRFANILRLAAR
jgi:DNA-binding beta-propeller fold protein YncE